MAGRIPQTFIDELLNRVDIVDVIDSRVALKKRGKEYMPAAHSITKKHPLSLSAKVNSFIIASVVAPMAQLWVLSCIT